jgi:hypothetical protein
LIPHGIANRKGPQRREGWRDANLTKGGNGLLNSTQVGSDGGCLPTPKSIQVDLLDTFHEELVMQARVVPSEVPTNVQVTLKGSEEVIPSSAYHVPVLVPRLNPAVAILILRLGMVECNLRWTSVAFATPNTITSSPSTSGCCKVCTKYPIQILPFSPTLNTVAAPVPKILGKPGPAKVYRKKKAG